MQTSYPDLLTCNLEPDHRHYFLLEQLPPCTIEVVAQLAVVVHLPPTISSPFATCHVDHEVAILLIVVNACIISVVRACSWREAVDLALFNESHVWPNPWLVGVEEFQCILFFMFPFHMLLLIPYRVPPNVE